MPDRTQLMETCPHLQKNRAQFMETDYRKEIYLKLSKAETKEEIERDKIKAQNDIIHFDPINCDVRYQCSGKR